MYDNVGVYCIVCYLLCFEEGFKFRLFFKLFIFYVFKDVDDSYWSCFECIFDNKVFSLVCEVCGRVCDVGFNFFCSIFGEIFDLIGILFIFW